MLGSCLNHGVVCYLRSQANRGQGGSNEADVMAHPRARRIPP
jgi:hypothetical protein